MKSHPLYSCPLLVCQVCFQTVPFEQKGHETIWCDRCGSKILKTKPRSVQPALAFSTTALIFYVPANFYPFMSIELYGNRNSSTIWGGIVSLAESGSVSIALIIFLASMVIPFLKLLALFYLAATAGIQRRPRFKTKLYHLIEALGRWSMLDIFLLAVLIAIMKLGPWTTVDPEPGSFFFALVVIFTMLASKYFDPLLLWKEKNDKLSQI